MFSQVEPQYRFTFPCSDFHRLPIGAHRNRLVEDHPLSRTIINQQGDLFILSQVVVFASCAGGREIQAAAIAGGNKGNQTCIGMALTVGAEDAKLLFLEQLQDDVPR